MKKILAIVQHRKDRSPGQRFRFEHFISHLEQNGYHIIFSNIISEKDDKIFYSHGKYFAKLRIVIKSFFHRRRDLKLAQKCNAVFIYREAFMLGTTYFERKLSKTGVPVIFDFDDAIWLNDTSDGNKNLAWMKRTKKTADICRYANLVTAGNNYLADYAKQYNPNTIVIPTTINTKHHKPFSNKDSESICIGWTGTSTTLKHLYWILPTLNRLKKKYGEKIYFKVIVNSEKWDKQPKVKLVQWKLETEREDLAEFDIGIMPLPDNEWTKGKCGFKGLLCMAMEIPVVMSPVGVNNDIINHCKNGFLCETYDEWFDALCKLIESKDLRNKLGKNGKQTVEQKYSVNAWNKKILTVFNEITKEKEN
jgi:glycosyltransferase involved in cell wall biosynthesis